MLLKILLWGIVGYIVFTWLQNRLGLKPGNNERTTIHHHHYSKKEKKAPTKTRTRNDDDYIDFEEVK